MQLKQGARILAIDDSFFRKGDKDNLLVGIIGRMGVVEGVISFRVSVDGDDATRKIIRRTTASRFSDQIRLIALNGVAVAGLNIVDLEEASKRLGMPVVNIVRRKPHSSELAKAIRLRGKDSERKLALLQRLNASFTTKRMNGFYVQCAGAEPKELSKLLPEAVSLLRLAHFVANGVATGESRGRI